MNLNLSTFPNLETDRLHLRRLAPNDAPAIYQLRSDPVSAKLTGRVPAKDINDAITFIQKIENLERNNTSIYWVISYKEDHDLIGTICLWNFDTENSSVEIGYELLPQHQRKGIMAEAIKAVIDFAFEKIMAQTITAFPSNDNPPSIAVLEKAGFKLTSDPHQNSHEDVAEMLTFTLTNKI